MSMSLVSIHLNRKDLRCTGCSDGRVEDTEVVKHGEVDGDLLSDRAQGQ